jgi:hypothetical protein
MGRFVYPHRLQEPSLRASDTMDIDVGRPMNKTQLAHAEGRRSRAAVVEFLADAFTDPRNPLTVEQLNEIRTVSFYFPDLSKPIADVLRRYADRPDLRDAILLAAAVQFIEKLIDHNPSIGPPKIFPGFI